MRIALSADHRGDAAAKTLMPILRGAGHDVALLADCR